MSQKGLKNKYLRKAHRLQRGTGKPPKLQASVEPFLHHGAVRPIRHEKGSANACPSSYQVLLDAPSFPGSRTKSVFLPLLDDEDTERDLPSQLLKCTSTAPATRSSTSVQDLRNESCTETLGQPMSSTASSLNQLDSEAPSEWEARLPQPHLSPVRGGHAFPNVRVRGVMSAGATLLSSTPYAAVPRHLRSMAPRGNREGELEVQLKVQGEVNRELKRLLVASVGGSLQHRLEQMVQEKTVLSRDLDMSLEQLAVSGEDLDRMAIECDIWRSKFLASRVMVDELATWKAELSLQFRESQQALQCLLGERAQLARDVTKCNHHLFLATQSLEASSRGHFGSSVAPSGQLSQHESNQSRSDQHHSSPGKTVLEVASNNTTMSESVSEVICSRASVSDNRNLNITLSPTPGENLAKQALQPHAQTMALSLPVPKLRLGEDMRAQGQRLLPLSHMLQQESQFHLNSSVRALSYDQDPFAVPFQCRKCRGSVIVI